MAKKQAAKKRKKAGTGRGAAKPRQAASAAPAAGPFPAERPRQFNDHFNTEAGFEELQNVSINRTAPTPAHLDALVQLARRTPGLEDVWDELEIVKKDFQSVFQLFQDELGMYYELLLDHWYDFRSMVLQRAGGLFTKELRAADRIAADIFGRFYGSDRLAAQNKTYADDARPVTFIGRTGPDGYYTWPPQVRRPLGIINVPQGSANNVWGWLALAHEVGHDIYASINGLRDEMEQGLETAMLDAAQAGTFSLTDVNFDDGINQIQFSGAEFAALLWKQWADEAQADVVGALNCGAAAVASLQVIIGFRAFDLMEHDVYAGPGEPRFKPEVHPTPYIRNIMNVAVLRALQFDGLAGELEQRFQALRPNVTEIEWRLGSQYGAVVTSQAVDELAKTVDVAASLLLDRPFAALNGHSYRDIIDFSPNDQRTADRVAGQLLQGDPFFDDGARPRHALAATMVALERDISKADLIHETFTQFLSPPR